jgi:hypothetical protein
MAAKTKTKYDGIVDQIMDFITEELESVPAAERKRRIKAASTQLNSAGSKYPAVPPKRKSSSALW